MDITRKIQVKVKKILRRLKELGIIKTFKLEIHIGPVEKNVIKNYIEIDSILKKCLKKIVIKPRRAEIRNIITELVRKKNSNDLIMNTEIEDKNAFECTKKNPLKFKCRICKKVFSSKKNFTLHNKLHIKSQSYLCEKCGEVFQSNKRWKQHMTKYNEGSRPSFVKYFGNSPKNKLITEKCLKISPESPRNNSKITDIPTTELEPEILPQNNVENHLQKTISENKFACPCGKVFRIWKSFKKHEKLKHSITGTEHMCSECGKCFIEKGKLNRHMLSHKGNQYHCSICLKQFARSDTLKRHLSICHYGKEEICCNFCQKRFKLKYNRDIHEENVHKNVSNWMQCERCGQKFKNKMTFKSHLKTHTNSRIKCTTCSKSFTRKSYYENHVKSKHSANQKLLADSVSS